MNYRSVGKMTLAFLLRSVRSCAISICGVASAGRNIAEYSRHTTSKHPLNIDALPFVTGI
jgi:hypothetical protein